MGDAPAVGFKSEDINLVTEFDKRSEALIVERLAAAFPDDRIVAEEGTTRGDASAPAQRVWYVDPLDGTTNFAHGLPLFSVSLGLTINRRPVLGVVEAPALGLVVRGHDDRRRLDVQRQADRAVARSTGCAARCW